MGVVGLILMVFLCPNPPRGAAETHGDGVTGHSSYKEDVKYLLKKYDVKKEEKKELFGLVSGILILFLMFL